MGTSGCVPYYLGSFAIVHLSQADYTPTVIGGEDAEDGEYPWMAALVYREHTRVSEAQFCGGVLIDSNWILTAAHFVRDQDLDDFIVAIGDEDLDDAPRLIAPRLELIHPSSISATCLRALKTVSKMTGFPAKRP